MSHNHAVDFTARLCIPGLTKESCTQHPLRYTSSYGSPDGVLCQRSQVWKQPEAKWGFWRTGMTKQCTAGLTYKRAVPKGWIMWKECELSLIHEFSWNVGATTANVKSQWQKGPCKNIMLDYVVLSTTKILISLWVRDLYYSHVRGTQHHYITIYRMSNKLTLNASPKAHKQFIFPKQESKPGEQHSLKGFATVNFHTHSCVWNKSTVSASEKLFSIHNINVLYILKQKGFIEDLPSVTKVPVLNK